MNSLSERAEVVPCLLQPGRNVWRLVYAERVALVVDGAAYYSLVLETLRCARHRVMLIGWEFDVRTGLLRDGPWTPTLHEALHRAVAERPDLEIYLLQWNLGNLRTMLHGLPPLWAMDWFNHPRVRYRLCRAHPWQASQHQKLVVVDDALAFCGGFDLTANRWDTREHAPGDPRRHRPSGRPTGPFHDVALMVDGAAARALGEIARERWRLATGEALEAIPPGPDPWPAWRPADLARAEIGIARTWPRWGGYPEVTEIATLLHDVIRAARDVLYIESQYFAATHVAELLAARLAEPDGPEIVLVQAERAEGWVQEKIMGSARAAILEKLHAADRHGRFRSLFPANDAGDPIYIHSQVLVADDHLLQVGSSNFNQRSVAFDSECDLVLEAGPGDVEAHRFIEGVRLDLLAEHLGSTPAELDAEHRRLGSWVQAVDALRRPRGSGRTLVTFRAKPLNVAERALAESKLFDPARPGTKPRRLSRFAISLARQRPRAAVALLAAGAALAALWVLRRTGYSPATNRGSSNARPSN